MVVLCHTSHRSFIISGYRTGAAFRAARQPHPRRGIMATKALILFGFVMLGFMALLDDPDRLSIAPREVHRVEVKGSPSN